MVSMVPRRTRDSWRGESGEVISPGSWTECYMAEGQEDGKVVRWPSREIGDVGSRTGRDIVK